MFVLFDQKKQRIPIKIWLKGLEELETECIQQATNLANLPFAFRHVALMPDTHSGYGMPIGGVLASREVVIPNAVGVDIGCGVAFIRTDLPSSLLRKINTPSGELGRLIVGQIMRSIPTGFQHQKTAQKSILLDKFREEITGDHILYPRELVKEVANGYRQLGTLGGGNHFIELQEDEEGRLGIMVHSGSRNFGYKICRYFNQLAKEKNRASDLQVPPEYDLAYLFEKSKEGQAYIRWMKLALDFARDNRQLMLERVVEMVADAYAQYARIPSFTTKMEVNAHHNYAALEEHFGEEVWIHRKGAIRAGKGELGIIPGAMGSFSYIVEGRGNPESFLSCSHGAGRKMGRNEALRRFTTEEVLTDLKARDVVLGKRKKSDVAEEFIKAYKDIQEVLAEQEDLVRPILRLQTVCVVKG